MYKYKVNDVQNTSCHVVLMESKEIGKKTRAVSLSRDSRRGRNVSTETGESGVFLSFLSRFSSSRDGREESLSCRVLFSSLSHVVPFFISQVVHTLSTSSFAGSSSSLLKTEGEKRAFPVQEFVCLIPPFSLNTQSLFFPSFLFSSKETLELEALFLSNPISYRTVVN